MALTAKMELELTEEVDRELLEQFINLVPPGGKINRIVSHVQGDRNMSDTYKVKLVAEWGMKG